jgi:hypothetical protein
VASKIDIGNVVLCEHVVPGLGNKHTLINVYSGDLIVTELPAKLMLALYMEYSAKAPEAFEVLVEIMMNKKDFGRLRFAVEAGPQLGVMAIPHMELGFDRDVVLEVRATVDGEKARRVLRKHVALGVMPIDPTA